MDKFDVFIADGIGKNMWRGNANGVGTADFTIRRLFDRMRFDQTYPNALTSTVVGPVKVPMVVDTDIEILTEPFV
ncbi:hypothetical protein [Caldanaerobius polysaccharolyticus]|uniref:hypothetical protein n=1 Tax=Caldanaerobius polysaccharolyticus TaxID=44256 RepID=UPI000479376C|nr:hypothetical protein [Caldanaerobius polysaccharolyticus]